MHHQLKPRSSEFSKNLPEYMRKTLAEIAAQYYAPIWQILSGCRINSVVRARDHMVAVLRWSSGMSYPAIGDIFNMDHTSVIVAVRRHEARINGEEEQLKTVQKARWAERITRLDRSSKYGTGR